MRRRWSCACSSVTRRHAVQWLCSLLLVWWRMASPCAMACARRRRGRWLVCAMRMQGHRRLGRRARCLRPVQMRRSFPDPGPGRAVRPGSTGPVDGDGVSSRQPFKRTKRMDRRLSHWQCTFCRHENPLSEQADVCGKCNGARQQLGDSDAVAREEARRSARSREAYGRALNAPLLASSRRG